MAFLGGRLDRQFAVRPAGSGLFVRAEQGEGRQALFDTGGEQIGQLGSFLSFSSRNRIRSASNSTSRPISESPAPRISLITSFACSAPMIPGSTPSTPPSAQDGTSPGGGGSGNKQR